MRGLITNGYIVYYSNVVAFKTEIIYDDDDDDNDIVRYNFDFLFKIRAFSSSYRRQENFNVHSDSVVSYTKNKKLRRG